MGGHLRGIHRLHRHGEGARSDDGGGDDEPKLMLPVAAVAVVMMAGAAAVRSFCALCMIVPPAWWHPCHGNTLGMVAPATENLTQKASACGLEADSSCRVTSLTAHVCLGT